MGRVNWWRSFVCTSTLLLAVVTGTGCGGSSGGDSWGGGGPLQHGVLPGGGSAGSGPAGPGSGEPVPFSPGSQLVALKVSPEPLVLYRGQTQQLTVQGIYANGRTAELDPKAVTITPRDPQVLSVSPGAVVTPLKRGDGELEVTVTTARGTVSQVVPVSVRRRLFVTHWGDDTLRVLDAQTYQQIQSVTLGGHPVAMVTEPTTDRLWVGVGDGQGIKVFNLADLNQPATEIGSSLPGFAYTSAFFNPLNSTMLWSHLELAGSGGSLQGFNATTLAPMVGSPLTVPSIRKLALNDTGTLLLNTIRETGARGLQIRDPDSLGLIAFVDTQQDLYDFPVDVVYDPANQCAYVSNEDLTPTNPSQIFTVDLSATPMISATTISVLPRPSSIALAGGRVFVSHFTSAAVSVYQTTTAGTPLTHVHTLAVGANPANLTIDSENNRLLVSCEATNSLYVFDLTTLDPIAGSPFAVGSSPADIVFEP